MLDGGDPIAGALTAAVAALEQTDPALPRQIFLVSNGLPECHAGAMGDALFEVYDGDAAVVASKAFAMGMPVHVIGVDIKDVTTDASKDGVPNGVNYFEKYEEIAMAGGTAPFVDANLETTLMQAFGASLAAAVAEVNPCLVALDITASDPAHARVVLNGEELAPVDDCAGASGYRFVGPLPHGSIEVCGEACAQFQAFGAVDVLYCLPSD